VLLITGSVARSLTSTSQRNMREHYFRSATERFGIRERFTCVRDGRVGATSL
jgi:hypothetical protein